MRKVCKFIKKNLLFTATVIIAAICFFVVSCFSGYRQKKQREENVVIHTFMVIVLMLVLCDTVKFLLLAIDKAWWPRNRDSYSVDRTAIVHTRTDYLKLKISILRSQLVATDKHCDESLNVVYQAIAKDLWLYGKYFLLLMSLVLATYDELLYYNTRHMQTLFVKNQTRTWGLSKVHTFDNFYTFLESALVSAFEPEVSKTGCKRWLYGDHTIRVGVVRLRQLRRKPNHHLGWGSPEYDEIEYMPRWQLPYERRPYTDKYWKIYAPWLPMYPIRSTKEKIFMNFNHYGYANEFPELIGYATMLASTYNSSMKVINYLSSMDWLTRKETLAIFIDFTLFNLDSNVFTVVSLTIEVTSFGTLEIAADFNSVKLLIIDHIQSIFIVTILFLYILVFIDFARSVVIMLWFEPSKIRNMWVRLDLFIIALNILLICLLITHEVLVSSLLAQMENIHIHMYLDFRILSRLHMACVVLLGFLICFTTLRLWRVLQFARVFQMITATLYAAWQALANIAMLIIIFLVGYGMANVIINGNYSLSFSTLSKSIVSSMCFAVGCSHHIDPADLLHGGRFLGMILYSILAFFIVILMMNLFASTINDFFCNVRKKQDERPIQNQITFLQFLKAEYAPTLRLFGKLPCFKRGYKRRNRTVHENIELILNIKLKGYIPKTTYDALHLKGDGSEENREDTLKHEKYKECVERMHTIAALMKTQFDLLEHMLFRPDVTTSESTASSESYTESGSEESFTYT